MSDIKKITVGLIGCGNAGRSIHMALLAQHANLFTVVACADTVPESAVKLGTDFGIKAHPSVEALIEDPGIELVVAATRPPSTHRDIAVAACARGKHVVVEKPMADTPAQCTEMIDAARRAKRVLSVHHNRRWDVDFLNARDALDRGLVGQPRLIRNEYSAGFSGSAYDWGIHVIDQSMCLSMGRKFVEISATMARPNPGKPEEGEGFFAAHLRTEDGVHHDLGMLPTLDGNAFRPGVMVPRFYLVGTTGVMHQTWCQRPEDAFGGSIRYQSAPGPEQKRHFGDPSSVSAKLAIPDFYDGIYSAIRAGGEPPVTAESARRSVHAWELICQASCSPRTLAIDL